MRQPLSPRERQALQCLARGQTYAEIGASMSLSPATVKVHLMRAYAKLNARNGPHAVAIGMAQHLVEVPA